MKINVRKLIEKISKYDYINLATLSISAEEVEEGEKMDKWHQEYLASKDKNPTPEAE